MELLEAKRKLEQRYNKQNEYNKSKYDRVSAGSLVRAAV